MILKSRQAVFVLRMNSWLKLCLMVFPISKMDRIRLYGKIDLELGWKNVSIVMSVSSYHNVTEHVAEAYFLEEKSLKASKGFILYK